MFLKNAGKLAFVNYANIWKILLYRILCLLCILGLTTVIAWPIINVLIKDNFFVELQKSFEGMLFNFNIDKMFLEIDTVFKKFAEIISNHGYIIQTVFVAIFDVIIVAFLEQYSSLALHESVGGYMSSLTKYGFTNAYVSNFGKATLMSLAKIITTLLLNLGIWVGMYFFASGLYSKIGVGSVILAFLLIIVLLALKNTIFCGWEPAYLIHNESVFVALRRGVIAVFRRFFKVLPAYLILYVLAFIINMFAFTLTAGVGLLVTLPLTTLSFVALSEVVYRELNGMRYYVDSEHIVSPKKLEQQDSFSKVKDII